SEMRNERGETVTDVVSEGMDVKVKVLEIDPRGKVRLSMRVVDQETGEELEDTRPPREKSERSDRGPRREGGGGGRGEGRGDRGPRRDGGGRDGGRGEGRGDRGPRQERSESGNNGGGDPDHVPAFLKD
ncbi:MAG: polyribonucleotide nucleotidyltransferase, partial [Sphingorhabdus sp.]